MVVKLTDGRSVITAALVSHSSGYAAHETDMAYVSVKADMYSYG